MGAVRGRTSQLEGQKSGRESIFAAAHGRTHPRPRAWRFVRLAGNCGAAASERLLRLGCAGLRDAARVDGDGWITGVPHPRRVRGAASAGLWRQACGAWRKVCLLNARSHDLGLLLLDLAVCVLHAQLQVRVSGEGRGGDREERMEAMGRG